MKITALALAALVGSAAIGIVPVLASDSKGFDSGSYITQLNYDGVHAIDAEDYWNGTLKATVKLANGSTVFQFFDKDSLQQVPYAFGR